MPTSKVLPLPGFAEASLLDASIQGLSVYVADAAQGTVDVLKLGGSRSRQGLTPVGQILKLTVGEGRFSNKSFASNYQEECVKTRKVLFC